MPETIFDGFLSIFEIFDFLTFWTHVQKSIFYTGASKNLEIEKKIFWTHSFFGFSARGIEKKISVMKKFWSWAGEEGGCQQCAPLAMTLRISLRQNP